MGFLEVLGKKLKSLSPASVQKKRNSDLYALALALAVVVLRIIKKQSGVRLSEEPLVQMKIITQFRHRMRIDAMEKFNQPTVFSTIHFFRNKKRQTQNVPDGVLCVYVKRQYLPELMRLLKYPYIDNDIEDEVLDGCGTLANLIAGHFRNELFSLGY